MQKKLSFRWTTPPGNSQFVIPFDTTRGPQGMSYASLAAGNEYLAPGPQRGLYASVIWRLTVKCTTNAVTFEPQVLTGVAGASADWENQAATGIPATVSAGVTSVFEFKPLTTDSRVLITAGAAGPGTLVVVGDIIFSADYGS